MIVKELHGKHYYIVLNYYQEVINVQEYISKFEVLQDEFWTLSKMDNEKWIIFSDASCGSFRGAKYSAWEKVKALIYKGRYSK